MANWSSNDNYKIDTWDPSSIKGSVDRNQAGTNSSLQNQQYFQNGGNMMPPQGTGLSQQRMPPQNSPLQQPSSVAQQKLPYANMPSSHQGSPFTQANASSPYQRASFGQASVLPLQQSSPYPQASMPPSDQSFTYGQNDMASSQGRLPFTNNFGSSVSQQFSPDISGQSNQSQMYKNFSSFRQSQPRYQEGSQGSSYSNQSPSFSRQVGGFSSQSQPQSSGVWGAMNAGQGRMNSPHMTTNAPQQLQNPNFQQAANQSMGYNSPLPTANSTFQPRDNFKYQSSNQRLASPMTSVAPSFYKSSVGTPACNTNAVSTMYNKNTPSAIFRNPLNDNVDEVPTALDEELKVNNIRATADKDQEYTSRRPSSIAKASLAQISHDLQKAGEPFESPSALKNFKRLSLGLPPVEEKKVVPEIDEDKLPKLTASRLKLVETSTLSVEAKEFNKLEKLPHPALQRFKQAIYEIICSPSQFEREYGKLLMFLDEVGPLDKETVLQCSAEIFESCIMNSNFTFLGAKLCDELGRHGEFTKGFRTSIMSLAQKEFSTINDVLKNAEDIEGAMRVRRFIKFIGELYIHLRHEAKSTDLIRFSFLGVKVLEAVEILLGFLSDENIHCLLRTITMCYNALAADSQAASEEGLEENFRRVVDKVMNLKNVYPNMNSSLEHDMQMFETMKNFKALEESVSSAAPLVEPSEDEEPPPGTRFVTSKDLVDGAHGDGYVYFTDSGKMYTDAEVMEKEYKDESITEEEMNKWNDQLKTHDYDADYDKFLNGLNPQ